MCLLITIPAGGPAWGRPGGIGMHGLGIKKFFVDYVVAFVLIFLSLYLLIGGITVIDMQVTASLPQSCSMDFPDEDVLHQLQEALSEREQCEMVLPCDGLQSVRCEAEMRASDLFFSFLKKDFLISKMFTNLEEPFGVASIKDTSTVRFPLSLIFFVVIYVVILVEAGAMLIALWRQRKLRETFSFPSGSRKYQLLTPVALAMLFTICVIAMNFLVSTIFGLPEQYGNRLSTALMTSIYGIAAIVVLAPLVEEVIFRGVLLRFFVEKKRAILGTFLVSLLFSIIHGFIKSDLVWQLYISSVYFTASLVLCWLYIKYRNLWFSIVFHSVYNSTMVILYKFMV